MGKARIIKNTPLLENTVYRESTCLQQRITLTEYLLCPGHFLGKEQMAQQSPHSLFLRANIQLGVGRKIDDKHTHNQETNKWTAASQVRQEGYEETTTW